MENLIKNVTACRLCHDLPLGPKPIIQFNPEAKILIAGQAPGRITHHKGRPFDDPSGKRLREWMGIDKDTFYDETKIAILPMGFCFPGTGKSGDLPPKPLCAETWRARLLNALTNIELTIVIGRYAMDWHLKPAKRATLTQIVHNWESYYPQSLPIPHPSPRNNRWLKINPWFEKQVLPILQDRVVSLITS